MSVYDIVYMWIYILFYNFVDYFGVVFFIFIVIEVDEKYDENYKFLSKECE